MYEISEHAHCAIELLHNSRDICHSRQMRPLAADVARACRLRVESLGILGGTEALDELIEAIPGKMRDELDMLYSVAEDLIVQADLARFKKALSDKDAPDWAEYLKSITP